MVVDRGNRSDWEVRVREVLYKPELSRLVGFRYDAERGGLKRAY